MSGLYILVLSAPIAYLLKEDLIRRLFLPVFHVEVESRKFECTKLSLNFKSFLCTGWKVAGANTQQCSK